LCVYRRKYNLDDKDVPMLSTAERKAMAAELTAYLGVIPPEERELPGFPGKPGKWERHGHGKWRVA
jgi:hypothetical protein